MDNSFLNNWKSKINATLENAGKDIKTSVAKSFTAAASSLTKQSTIGGKTRFFGKILDHAKKTRHKLHKAQTSQISIQGTSILMNRSGD